MKNFTYLIIFILLNCSVWVSGQSHSLIFEDLDQAILDVYYDNEMSDYASLVDDLVKVSKHWEKAKVELSQNIHCEHLYCESFCIEIDYAISALQTLSTKNRYQYIEENLFYLIQEFANLRMAYELEEYALDNLWLSYRMSNELNDVANDQMMELLDWEEYEDSYCSLFLMWNKYKSFAKEEINSNSELQKLIVRIDNSLQTLESIIKQSDYYLLAKPTKQLKDLLSQVLISKSTKESFTIQSL